MTVLTKAEMTRGMTRYAIKMIGMLLIFGAVLFVSAGRLDWPAGWVYLGLNGLVQLLVMLVLVPRHPDLIAERSKVQSNTKPYDRILAPAVSLLGPLAWMIVAGLDYRFGWSAPLPLFTWVVSLGLGLASSLFVLWAMDANRFFAATMRIQVDRGHEVVREGPYAQVRHPGYIGSIIYDLSVPGMLGSEWAYIPVLITVALTVLRTALEDRALRRELPGYKEYAKKVKYRLVPGLW